MKKILPLLFFAALFAALDVVQAQSEYHPITEGCTWSVSNEKYMTAGDTVLDGKTYLKIYRQVSDQPFEFSLDNAEYFAAIRNDSAEKKVYAYLPAGKWVRRIDLTLAPFQTEEAQEVLIFDYSLHLGDTVHFFTIGEYTFFECEAVCVESAHIWCGEQNGHLNGHQYTAEDSLVYLSDNSSRRQLFLRNTSIGVNLHHVWIEGIGSIHGNDEMALSLTDAGEKILLCFTDSTATIYQTGFDFDNEPNDCFSNGFGGDVPERTIRPISVYPNPADDLLYVELSGAGIANAVLYDLQGRIVADAANAVGRTTTTINVHSVPASVYLLRVTDTDGNEYHRKIVKK